MERRTRTGKPLFIFSSPCNSVKIQQYLIERVKRKFLTLRKILPNFSDLLQIMKSLGFSESFHELCTI